MKTAAYDLFTNEATPVIRRADLLWQAYSTARAAMDAAFDALLQTSDGQWTAAVARLRLHQQQATAAAAQWDAITPVLADAQHRHERSIPENRALTVTEVAHTCGIDASGWHLGSFPSETDLDPLSPHLATTIQEQTAAIGQ